jgi:glycosyl transferase family 2
MSDATGRWERPELSVVLVTPDCYETIRRTVAHLRAQTIREQIELLIAVPCAAELEAVPSELEGFFGHQVIETGALDTVGRVKAEAIRAARAPVVALAEDHAYPDRDWAAALVAAHRHGWAVVGPVVRNANPATMVSWADLAVGYGPWLDPHPGGEVDHLPGHNSSYKRDVLLGYGEALAELLEAEAVLQWNLRSRGHRLYLEPRAKVSHTNFARRSTWARVQILNGRVFAATRAWGGRWGLPRRALFVVGAPLIPVVRCWRIVRIMRRREPHRRVLMRLLPTLLFGLTFDALGQALGYALGAGDAKRQMAGFEFHRERHSGGGERPTAAPLAVDRA